MQQEVFACGCDCDIDICGDIAFVSRRLQLSILLPTLTHPNTWLVGDYHHSYRRRSAAPATGRRYNYLRQRGGGPNAMTGDKKEERK